MTASSFTRQTVGDFATWKKVYDGSVQARKDGGVIAESIHRDPDDPNSVIVYNQFRDLRTAQEFVAAFDDSAAFKAALEMAGVKPGTLEIWLGEDL